MQYPEYSYRQTKPSKIKLCLIGIGSSILITMGLLLHFAEKAEQNLPDKGQIRIKAINVGGQP